MALNALQLQSLATSEAGNAFATYEMQRTKGAALKFLQNLIVTLPAIPVGGATPLALGTITGELEASQGTVTDTSSQLYGQIGSIISLVSASQATSTGTETVDQAILVGVANNVVAGIQNALAFAQGEAAGQAGA
jgi:hypothetical protein